MNNEQFRRLVDGSSAKSQSSGSGNGMPSTGPRLAALGSRQTSSIPMTPRSVSRLPKDDFARQLAEKNQKSQSTNQQQKFRSFAPKGSKLAAGYVDRAKTRESAEEDERVARLQALEEAFKREEIDRESFEKLRKQVAGGDLSSTHLVKGLDFELLARIRQGENVYGDDHAQDQEEEPCDDIDDELNQLEEEDVAAIEKDRSRKKGQLSTSSLNASKKRSRDQILAEMKAAREAAKAKQVSILGSRFKKFGAKAPGTRIERDSKGQEVMIIADEDGNEKRKVRKLQPKAEESLQKERDLMVPDPKAKPLGMEVPDFYKAKVKEPEDEDVNIFDDVDDDYNPLAGLDEDSDDDAMDKTKPDSSGKEPDASMPPPMPSAASEPRNYFKDAKTALASAGSLKAPSMSDPAIQAALKKAASIQALATASEEDDEEARAKAERRRKMLENNDRDAEDMDMGFGTSRFEDDADFDEKRVKFSQWGREDEDDDGARNERGRGSKRKRGPKKRKGDGNNAADVLREMERQRAAK
ncbi:hypothetical protein GGR57DRAFT_450237 [Xylariaceae sp. FL1272]|nr:hypothetical protein GGR57DRAFT_450237 [Xylariaceae sp. FL1272]